MAWRCSGWVPFRFRRTCSCVAILTAQRAQLDQANRAWQQYQQTQLDNFRSKLVDYLPIDEHTSFDEIAQQIVDQITEERKDFTKQYQEILQENELLINQIENQPIINKQEQDTQTIGKHLI